jgi:hypothetical protein
MTMLHIDIHNTETGEVVRVGTLEEFAGQIVKGMRNDIQFTSKWFQTKGIVDRDTLVKGLESVLDGIVQRARDLT